MQKKFGEKLRTLRQQCGLTQSQLSDMLGVRQTYVWKLEHGQKTPNVAMVVKIAQLFNVSADQLIMDDFELA